MKKLTSLIVVYTLTVCIGLLYVSLTTNRAVIAKTEHIEINYEYEYKKSKSNEKTGEKFDVYEVRFILTNLKGERITARKNKKDIATVSIANCKNVSGVSFYKCESEIKAIKDKDANKHEGRFLPSGGRLIEEFKAAIPAGEMPVGKAEINW